MSDRPSADAEARLRRLCSALGLGDHPHEVLGALDALYAEVDRELEEKSRGLELPCKPGCDACCHESVFVSAPEYLAVAAELLVTRAPAEVDRISAEMSILADRFADELELLEIIEPGAERDEVAARVKFRCPLLADGGACSVYRARELNARTFGQSFDHRGGTPYGCELTHARLVVLGNDATRGLADAREARRKLAERWPTETARVHVYPWWFTRFPI